MASDFTNQSILSLQTGGWAHTVQAALLPTAGFYFAGNNANT